jgi:hypothetical protein
MPDVKTPSTHPPTTANSAGAPVPFAKALPPGSELDKKWPASTTLADLRRSTYGALFERNVF